MTQDNRCDVVLFSQHPYFAGLAKEAAALLAESDARNYIELCCLDDEGNQLTITVRRTDGETPGERAQRLEKENAELRQLIDDLQYGMQVEAAVNNEAAE